ncbi:MAG: hypothetical protein RLZZ157_9 [Pseudomonadota bacterium]|jgi:hypothetical protein
MPEVGAPRFDLRPDMRLLPMGNCLILYCAIEESAEIVRLVHGARCTGVAGFGLRFQSWTSGKLQHSLAG